MPFHWRWLVVLGLAALIAACELAEPSERSNQLERVIVPTIVAWSNDGEAVLRLSDLGDFHASELVCLVTEYRNLNDIESSDLVGEMRGYHSSFGNHVPENRVALVVVSGQRAHAAVLPRRGVFRSILDRTKCVQAPKAVLRRTIDPLAIGD